METKNWLSERIKASRPHQDKIWTREINDLTIASRTKGRGIVCSEGNEYTDFMSCSYLGLEQHPALIHAIKESVDKFGVQYAAARTRAKCDLFDELEVRLNAIFLNAYTVVFNSVGAAHLAVLPMLGSGELPGYAISSKGIRWIVDKTTHATVQVLRGILEQFGAFEKIIFSDQNAVYAALQTCRLEGKTPVLISDSLGSMGGSNNIEELIQLARKFEGYYYVDDAHGTSIAGKNGCGYTLHQLGEFHENLILLSSLSKAFGSHGGAASFSHPGAVSAIKKYSLNYIFSGPPSLPGIAACVASADIHLTSEITALQAMLKENIEFFDRTVLSVEVKEKNSPIRTIHIGCENEAINTSAHLRSQGFLVTAAMYPTVPKSESIIRIAISAAHSKAELERFAASINALTGKKHVD
ncbi:aminotransferase class I/II-fold pyridoxal phosphate-dependent enzyme [Enterobacter bugandensis]|uniref:aminotransferase class I/II-fold pyridoxal phosphate-dependent enzyme n=1 Tax=Enterobacter bugandensis TaxID=881260 RepID=UPI0020763070|nr:aminotransferase class I/II-fold pyridoxal phosphate-dependent enzyme [Enterobacter bugandensis]MCM7239259.1 aminotransferase class I/II-fold pyridoxal phosphate-dependent enzyme [Enterobacter bugandensis]MCM7319044.1 aminotransferase class I/II-fold pyridoxal phosphate-dependent enzyme [Enterobacter bugandensis]MCM7354629.1 aminotransferase class I/II-fold pyridoxal phosphate-dependent enzyme [Enterobacter bugandensis]